ncbi:centromere protein O [Dunckerocampus dactyliophorus]|uniref:centromere protein O n=1 Tax=Dunckerocampus dactyliophorus TaxID=161453 RepID=UPI0024053F75|nr:centromere protein O [Dunckerocampus dactyliophorus]
MANNLTSAGVLSQLSALELQARSRKAQLGQRSRVKELRARMEALTARRDLLRAHIQTLKDVQKHKTGLEERGDSGGDGMESEDPGKSQVLQLMARQTQLRELLHAHHVIGGYDIVQTRQGKGVCVTLATAYEGVYLDSFQLEIDLRPTLRIRRHNVPPFIPLGPLTECSHLQADVRGFLDTLGTHLNAFAGRKQQLKLVKELHTSVQVMESNVLCSILVLMLTTPTKNTAMLCSLDYTDHARCLPTRVRFHCQDEELPDSPAWMKNSSLLIETPVHRALASMKKLGHIV